MSRTLLKYCTYVSLGIYATTCAASGVAGVELLLKRDAKSICDCSGMEILKSFNSGIYAMHVIIGMQAYFHYKQVEEFVRDKYNSLRE